MAASKSNVTSLGSALAKSPVASRLAEEARNYAVARGVSLTKSASDRLKDATQRLDDHAADPSALGVGIKKLAEGKSPMSAGATSVGTGIKNKVKSIFRRGGSSAPKMTNIVEDIDIGAPVSVVYDQWTQFQEFASFMKGVQSVDQRDEVETSWHGKVWWSKRTWNAKVNDQIPDRRITWTSEGAKGSCKGVVTFHPLADDLTKVLLVLEYYPSGFFEKTANLWRAVGRRARLDLKHFRRFVSAREQATGSWRGEVRDGEIVRQPDEADDDSGVDGQADDDYDEVEDESGDGDENAPDDESGDEGEYEDEPEGEYEDDEPEGDYDDEGEYDDEREDGDEPEDEEQPEDEDESVNGRGSSSGRRTTKRRRSTARA